MSGARGSYEAMVAAGCTVMRGRVEALRAKMARAGA